MQICLGFGKERPPSFDEGISLVAPPRFELGTPASSGQRSTTELKSHTIVSKLIWTLSILLEVERSDKLLSV